MSLLEFGPEDNIKLKDPKPLKYITNGCFYVDILTIGKIIHNKEESNHMMILNDWFAIETDFDINLNKYDLVLVKCRAMCSKIGYDAWKKKKFEDGWLPEFTYFQGHFYGIESKDRMSFICHGPAVENNGAKADKYSRKKDLRKKPKLTKLNKEEYEKLEKKLVNRKVYFVKTRNCKSNDIKPELHEYDLKILKMRKIPSTNYEMMYSHWNNDFEYERFDPCEDFDIF
jgi:hypothetical protein